MVRSRSSASHAGGQSAGFYFTIGDRLDLKFLTALRILDVLRNDLDAVFARIHGIEQIDGILFVFLDTVVSFIQFAGDTSKLNPL